MKIAVPILALVWAAACNSNHAPRFRGAEELSKGDVGTATPKGAATGTNTGNKTGS